MFKPENVYRRFPIPIQNMAVSTYGWLRRRKKFGAAFNSELQRFRERASWQPADLAAYRDQKVRGFVRHAYETTQYYQDLFDELGAVPEDFRSLNDLKKLPTLEKVVVRQEPERFISGAYASSSLVWHHTSGTTGAGLVFPTTHHAISTQWAVWWRYREWHGIQRGEKCAVFTGGVVVPIEQTGPPFFRVNYVDREIYFSGYHLNSSSVEYYVEHLRDTKPLWMHGYPSMISALASLMEERGLSLDYDMKWITLGAENVLDHQLETIQRVFGVKPVQHYGMAEASANISEHPDGIMRVDEDFAAVEFRYDERSGAHKILGTNFTNLAFPLICYDAGDLAHPMEAAFGVGAFQRAVKGLDGRKEDYLLRSDGSRVGRVDHFFKDAIHVREAQVHQEKRGTMIVRIVPDAAFTVEDEYVLRGSIVERMGPDMKIDFEYLDEIPRSKNGKLRLVTSNIDNE